MSSNSELILLYRIQHVHEGEVDVKLEFRHYLHFPVDLREVIKLTLSDITASLLSLQQAQHV